MGAAGLHEAPRALSSRCVRQHHGQMHVNAVSERERAAQSLPYALGTDEIVVELRFGAGVSAAPPRTIRSSFGASAGQVESAARRAGRQMVCLGMRGR